MQLSQRVSFSTSKPTGGREGLQNPSPRETERPSMSHALRYDLWLMQFILLGWGFVFLMAATFPPYTQESGRHLALAIALAGGTLVLNIIRQVRDLKL